MFVTSAQIAGLTFLDVFSQRVCSAYYIVQKPNVDNWTKQSYACTCLSVNVSYLVHS